MPRDGGGDGGEFGHKFAVRLAWRGDLEDWRRDTYKAHIKSINDAVKEVGGQAKGALRDDVSQAGLGKRLAFTWRGDMVVKERSADPAYWIFSRAEDIIASFDRGVVITVAGAKALAVPIPGGPAEKLQAYPGGGGKVRAAEAKWGELFVIPEAGDRPAMLAAKEVGFTKSGNLRQRKRTRTGKRRKGTLSALPLFFLFDETKMGDLLRSTEIIARYEAKAGELIARLYVRQFELLTAQQQ